MCHMWTKQTRKKRKKKNRCWQVKRRPSVPAYKADWSEFSLPDRFIEAGGGLKGHPLTNGTSLGRSELNRTGFSSCQNHLGNIVSGEEEPNRLYLFRLRQKESGSDEANRFPWSLRWTQQQQYHKNICLNLMWLLLQAVVFPLGSK